MDSVLSIDSHYCICLSGFLMTSVIDVVKRLSFFVHLFNILNMAQQPKRPPTRGSFSSNFMEKLMNGQYAKLIQTALDDKELDIQLRDNYINVYYCGGNILRICPQSFQFDKFYFYLPQNGQFPKSHIEKVYSNKTDKISHNTKLPIPSKEEATAIIQCLESQNDKLMRLLGDNIKEYFKEAKQTMKTWFALWKKEERNDQHTIALSNKRFNTHSDLVVVDIEFAVSSLHPYNYAKNSKGERKVCRFDIIAVDKQGQIYVIELKQNDKADTANNKANVEVHLEDFCNTIEKDSDKSFVSEIAGLIKVKQTLGILSNDVFVDIDKHPIFAVAFSGDKPENFNDKYVKAGLKVVNIKSEDDKKYLKLK